MDSYKMNRIESDSIGTKEVPVNAYYGVQSLRAVENFPITGQHICPEMINSLALLKKTCAVANKKANVLDSTIADAIIAACDEVLQGKYHDQFIVDPIQGGAGTSMNMNANEVIANIANCFLGGSQGDYHIVHPNDHVNCGQSTNDIVPTAGKLTCLVLLRSLDDALQKLYDAMSEKSRAFDSVIKMGRTQLQDAVPVRLGQEFAAYATAIKRNHSRILTSARELLTVNLGGTAIGTGLNADTDYFKNVVHIFSELSGFAFEQAEDMIDSTQNIDCFASVSGAIKNCALALSKIANDLRLLSSGPKTGFEEINLPARQNGSSIMPGKVNPVIPEVVNQVAFRIAGNDITISLAVEAGQLELNAFEPVIFDALFQSIKILEKATLTFTKNCVNGITANEDHCKELLDSSVGIVTALCPHIGYAKAAMLAKKSLKEHIPVRTLVEKEGVMSKDELDKALNVYKMTGPGIL